MSLSLVMFRREGMVASTMMNGWTKKNEVTLEKTIYNYK